MTTLKHDLLPSDEAIAEALRLSEWERIHSVDSVHEFAGSPVLRPIIAFARYIEGNSRND